MKKTNENITGVQGIVKKARALNPEIGQYVEHFINADFGYSVKLTDNGSIRMSRKIAEHYEEQLIEVTEEMIQTVASTFRKTK